jgi:hypothetical protein
MKTYVNEENQVDQKKHDLQRQKNNQNDFFEDIDSTEKNDDEKNQFLYNLNINSSDICKKCDTSREKFKFNNLFHKHIRECFDDKFKLE